MIISKFLATLGYVTSLPVGKHASSVDLISGLGKYLPIAGIVIGALTCAIYVPLVLIQANDFVGAALLTTALIVLSGGLHLDGLMDTADGICSHKERTIMLEIMKDSRVGNFGAITGILAILLKTCAIAALFSLPVKAMAALILIPCWARWTELYAIANFSYAREFGSGKIWHETTKKSDLLIGALIPLTVTVLFTTYDAFYVAALIPATIIPGVIAAHWLNSKLHGQTGDTYGAVVEVSETIGLVLASCISTYC
ncbi:MAG: adenosylcobinamide-GDP ribazoletransferase [Candidatus Obscuribacterales bacterium]|nr:adenosylcobinamide-GDP ribazoletransferase [Candidatus Obscuribacterales bacterium]